MESREKIKQLLNEGKINSDQATILLNALKESGTRRERIFKDVLTQKKKREKGRWGFLGLWFLFVFFSILVLVATGIRQGVGQDITKALSIFNEASLSIEKGNYKEAVGLLKKGIRRAPRFALGYTLLGTTYKHIYEKTKDPTVKEEERKAFEKARDLKEEFTRRRQMNAIAIFFTGLLLLLIAGIISLLYLLLYNHLVKSEEKTNEAWAQLQTYYDRKANLIPALLEAIKNYAKHEKETLENVTQAREKATGATEAIGLDSLKEAGLKKILESQEVLKGALNKVYAVAENYPDLKANINFLTIQEQLEKAEDEIVYARSLYNKKVRAYNSSIRSFPLNLIAASYGFDSKGYFEGQIKTQLTERSERKL